MMEITMALYNTAYCTVDVCRPRSWSWKRPRLPTVAPSTGRTTSPTTARYLGDCDDFRGGGRNTRTNSGHSDGALQHGRRAHKLQGPSTLWRLSECSFWSFEYVTCVLSFVYVGDARSFKTDAPTRCPNNVHSPIDCAGADVVQWHRHGGARVVRMWRSGVVLSTWS